MVKIINWMGGWPKDGLVSASDWEERLAAAAERSRRAANSASSRLDAAHQLQTVLAHGLLRDYSFTQPSHLWLAAGADTVLSRLIERSLQPGQVVLTETLTSRSALQLFRKAGLQVECVPSDGGGMDLDLLAAAISQHRPRLVYVSPVCSDPEGALWAAGRFTEVSRICRDHGVLLLRDDRQAMLLYDEAKWVDHRLREQASEGVISIGQLPPGLVAGLRFGWAAGDSRELAQWLHSDADDHNQGAAALEREALSALLHEQPLEPLLDMFRVQCAVRMRRLTDLLAQGRVPGLSTGIPAGGAHLWVTLPDGLDGEALLRGAWLKGLMFQPGAPFYASQPQRNKLRLTFAYADERQMKQGVSRLIDVIGDFLGRFDIG